MPVEIQELIIKTTVTKDDSDLKNESFEKIDHKLIKLKKSEIIEECMDRLKDYLNELKEK